MEHLDRAVEPSGLMMSYAKGTRMGYHNVCTPDGEYTTVNIVKMPVLSVLVSLTPDTGICILLS